MKGLPKSRAEARQRKAAWYFSGKPCRSGHVDRRFTANGSCHSCLKVRGNAYMRRRRAAQPELYRERCRRAYNKETPAQRRYRYDRQAEWRRTPRADIYRLGLRIRCRINQAVRSAGTKKQGKTVTLLGCTVPKYRRYIEARFLPGMSWENWGLWHLDHIKAVTRFNLATRLGQKLAFNYRNTQPLWGADNLRKGAR